MSEESATVYVSRGRTVTTGGWPALDQHGPGSQVQLPLEDAARLRAAGFVQDAPPFLDAPSAIQNPANIGLQNQQVQGPTYRR